MLKKKTVLKFILGLKIRQLRIRRDLSLKELADIAELSVSYLNEIEKGKKYPKFKKLAAIAEGLKIDLGELVSFKTGRNLHPLLKFLEGHLEGEFPLEIFDVSDQGIVDMMGHDPEKFASFVLTILQLSRAYDLKTEDVYAAALRSFIETHGNYFLELEESASKCRREWNLTLEAPQDEKLRKILEEKYHYQIDETLLGEDELLAEQKVISKRDKKRKLFLHPLLSREQKAFYFASELGHVFLGTESEKKNKTYSMTLQDYKARYYAGALLIDEKAFSEDLQSFFSRKQFCGDVLLDLIQKYKVDAETFFHRMTQMLSAHFKTDDIFFLEVNWEEGKALIKNELHLTQLHGPHGVRMNEHYCERWIAVKSIKQVEKNPLVMAQISVSEGGREYFSLSLAQFSAHRKQKISFTIGFAISPELCHLMKFHEDKSLQRIAIGQTCERCFKQDCAERLTPAFLHLKKKREEEEARRIFELIS